jgi:hypothetical protein
VIGSRMHEALAVERTIDPVRDAARACCSGRRGVTRCVHPDRSSGLPELL